MYPKNSKRPIAIDLFSGAGGLSLGFEQAGFDINAAVEIDPIHCAAHKFNFPLSATICQSVSAIDGKAIRKSSGIADREISVVFGGAPCQGFSMIGKRALDDPRNELVYHFVRLVHELKPKYFVFENVKGLTIGSHRRFLEEIIEAFEAKGKYHILLPYSVLNAADYGVPQDRKRLFLIGARRDQTLPHYPTPLSDRVTVWEAIGDLPEPEKYPELLEDDCVRAPYGDPSAYARKLRGLANEPGDYSYPRLFDRDLLTSSLRATHTPLSRKRFGATPHGQTEPISRFHKLDPKGVCNTLRSGTASDRGAFTSPRPIHPYTPRCITVREAARIHSYPDWFRFHVTKWHGFRQIGNSVPPLLARAVASQVMKALGLTPITPDKTIKLGDTSMLSLSMAEAAALFGVPSTVIPKRIRMNIATEQVYV